MRVLMFCPQFRPLIGGAERKAENLSRALVAMGCRVTVLTPKLASESPDRETIGGVQVERFALADLARRYPFPGIALANIPYIVWQVMRAVGPALRGADVMHCHTGCLQLVGAAILARIRRVPMLCTASTGSDRSDLGEIEQSGRSGRFVAALVRMAVPAWVAPSDAARDALIRAGVDPGTVHVIPNAADVPGITREPARPARRFLYLGRLSSTSRRDFPTVIEAFDSLGSSFPDAELALVGGGDQLEEMRKRAASCAAAQRIHLPGFDDPAKWLAWSDCFLLPSRLEGLSLALLEAMAAGRPCIANDIPENREALGDGEAGILVPINDVQALLRAMRSLATDTSLAARLAEAVLKRVRERYSLDIVARGYLESYRRLAGKM